MNDTPSPIHPFPARMAPEVALRAIYDLPNSSTILDPMVGSGTVVRFASDRGHRCYGYDMDPLAVLMSRVWTTPVSSEDIVSEGDRVVTQAKELRENDIYLDWMDDDAETLAYVHFWYGKAQMIDLRKLAYVLSHRHDSVSDALKVALSRIIITKDRGASLARDVSHSRPHRVRIENDYNVIQEFSKSCRYIAGKLKAHPPLGNANIKLGDARNMNDINDGSIDCVITSPPYLNAIDYMRGHRLSLVWLGYPVHETRHIKQSAVGTESGRGCTVSSSEDIAITSLLSSYSLPTREQRILRRYTHDIIRLMNEIYRVARVQSKAILVVGNSCLRGIEISNSEIIKAVAESIGFSVIDDVIRTLPPNRRYMPPPTHDGSSSILNRMKTENIITLLKS